MRVCNGYAQDTVRSVDVQTLKMNEYVVLHTTNGTQCVCVVHNSGSTEKALVVAIGDTGNNQFDNDSSFNGIHQLKIQEQIIAIADFKGSNIIVSNYSLGEVQVSILCQE